VSVPVATVILLLGFIASTNLLTTGAYAYEVRLSNVPSAFQLDRESSFLVIIDLEEDESIQFEKIIISIYDIKDELVAVGNFAPDGEIIESGNFLVSVELIEGSVSETNVTGSDHEISYLVTIRFSSNDFGYSYGNEMRVVVYRGEGLVPLLTSFAPFDIGIPPPWATIISAIVVIDVAAMIVIYYYLKKRKGNKPAE
jgi:hypothetical protein